MKKEPVKYVYPDTGATSEEANSLLLWMWNTQEHHKKPYTVIEIRDKVLPEYYRDVSDKVKNSELKEIEILHKVYIRQRAEDFKNSGGYGTVGGQAEDRANRTLSPLLESVFLMTANGNRLELPKTNIDNYTQVKDFLIKAGGKYKKLGFEFKKDAQEVKDRLLQGEVINDKKKFQFYQTQPNEIKRVQELADVQSDDLILEPSAGYGVLVEKYDLNQVEVMELNPECREVLQLADYNLVGEPDFLANKPVAKYDKILANPPFTKNQDIKHIKHMYDFLKPGGRLVSVASASWQEGNQKLQIDFREWLKKLNAHVEDIADGAFKKSGANFASVIIVIDKES